MANSDNTSVGRVTGIRLSCFLLSALAAIGLGFFTYSAEEAIQIVKHGGYWLMLLTFVLLLLSSLGLVRRHSRSIKIERLPVLYIFLMSLILCVLQENGFKILMDEPVLAATALQMHEEKEVMTVARAYTIDGNTYLLDAFLDKRPYFFPFLTSLLHDLTGYRAMQGVWLNMILAPAFLGLLFSVARRLGGSYCGYLAVALLTTVPLVSMNVNGAGFELLNLVMLLSVLRLAMHYSEKPEASGMNVMLLFTVLLVQTRYESALYVIPVGLLILFSWWKSKQLVVTKTLVLVPLLLIMVPLQQSVFSVESHDVWQLKGDAQVPFSIAFVGDNLRHALSYFFSTEPEQPNSLLLSALFALSIMATPFLRDQAERGRKLSGMLAPVLFAAFVCVSFMLLMAYHWGQLDDVIATRIALPFIILQVLVVAVVFSCICKKVWWRWLGLVCCVVFFLGVTFPKTQTTDFLNRSPVSDQAKWLQSKVLEHKKQNPLFVADLHMIALVEKVSTLPSFMAPDRKLQIDYHLRKETFGEILFFYQLEVNGAGEFEPPLALTDNFSLEILDESLMPAGQAVQFARLRAVKFSTEDTYRLDEDIPDPQKEPAEYFKFFAKSLP